MKLVMACLKMVVFALLCAITIPTQFLWLVLFRNSPHFFIVPKLFHRLTALIFNIKVDVEGAPVTDNQVIFLGNHISYIDIPVLGSFLKALFIAKAEVKQWPVFGVLANISSTIFIERTRDAAAKCIQDIEKSLSAGRSLILFPEGTSSQGIDVLPFKSSIFELFLSPKLKDKLVVQPFTISIQETNAQTPQTNQDLDLYAWHGDMELAPHLWALAQSRGARIKVIFHPPRPAKDYDNRKKFALACHQDTATGLSNALPPSFNIPP